jgi:hypothetical protein
LNVLRNSLTIICAAPLIDPSVISTAAGGWRHTTRVIPFATESSVRDGLVVGEHLAQLRVLFVRQVRVEQVHLVAGERVLDLVGDRR